MAVSRLSSGCIFQVSLLYFRILFFFSTSVSWLAFFIVPSMRLSLIFYKIKHVDTIKCVISADSVKNYCIVQSLISRHFSLQSFFFSLFW